jgi:hypothetical protein
LSESAQELLFEGQHLHHWRESVGADPVHLRALARNILARSASQESGQAVAYDALAPEASGRPAAHETPIRERA